MPPVAIGQRRARNDDGDGDGGVAGGRRTLVRRLRRAVDLHVEVAEVVLVRHGIDAGDPVAAASSVCGS